MNKHVSLDLPLTFVYFLKSGKSVSCYSNPCRRPGFAPSVPLKLVGKSRMAGCRHHFYNPIWRSRNTKPETAVKLSIQSTGVSFFLLPPSSALWKYWTAFTAALAVDREELWKTKAAGFLEARFLVKMGLSAVYIVLWAWYTNQNEAESCVYGRTAYISTHLSVPVLQAQHENILTKSSSTQTFHFLYSV